MLGSRSEAIPNRPYRPLVVKCGYDGRTKRVTFPSAATCRLDSLRARVEESFHLSALLFNLIYTDEDGEDYTIKSEFDLTEAISYFISGDDANSVRSIPAPNGAGPSSPISYPPQKIVLRLEVVVEYDGPSLSDTSSLNSFSTGLGESEESQSHRGSGYTESIRSLTLSSSGTDYAAPAAWLNPPPPDPGIGSRRTVGLTNGNLQRGSLSGQRPRVDGSQSSVTATDEVIGPARRPSQTSTTRSAHAHKARASRSSRTGGDTIIRRSSDETARETSQDTPLTGPDSRPAPALLTGSELGSRWLREQSSLATARRIGPRSRGRSGTIRGDESEDSDMSDEESDDIALVRDARGKYYYSYGSDAASIRSNGDAYNAEDGPGPTSQSLARTSMQTLNTSTNATATLDDTVYGATPELAPDCSACGIRLDYMRYVCRDCGESHAWREGDPDRNSGILPERGFELCAGCIESYGVAHARSVNGTPPRNGFIQHSGRHTFREKIWGTHGWSDVEYTEDAECTICHIPLYVNRYKCVSCPKFDLCGTCHLKVEEIHPAHAFLSLPDIDSNMASTSHTHNGIQDTAITPVRHPGAFCHDCLRDIVGPRFHCAVCPSWDLCIDCEGKGAQSEGSGHTADHIMMKIPLPMGNNEVEAVSRRARDRWFQQDSSHVAAAASQARQIQTSPQRSPSPTNETVYAGGNRRQNGHAHTRSRSQGLSEAALIANAARREALDHNTRCSHCHDTIKGKRYQCANCPSEPEPFNLCSACEPRSYRIHDPRHVFFKFERPVDIPLTSPNPFLPILYKGQAGQVPPSVQGTLNTRDPEAYLKYLIHRETLCDIHSDQIKGAWLRCAHCAAGFDICQEAEEIANHDKSHVFIVFKGRVNMNTFRQVAHLEELHSEPLLKRQVYYT